MAPVRWIVRRLSLLLLGVLVAMPVLQVVLREFLGRPFVGAEELARFMLICTVFVALPTVVASGGNIRMEEVLGMTPHTLQRSLRLAISSTGLVGFGIAAASVLVATLRNLNNATPTLEIPYYVFFAAAFVGLALAAVECAIQLGKALLGRPIYVVTAEEEAPGEAVVL